MIPRGAGYISGLRNLKTGQGLITERNRFLNLYRLTIEKDNLMMKHTWIKRQKEQTEKRLSEIALSMRAIEERAHRELASRSHSESRSTLKRK